jgi:hypothetical protein
MDENTCEASNVSNLEQLAAVLRVLPDASVLVAGSGQILVANDLARDALALEAEFPDDVGFATLTQHVDRFRDYFRLCTRSLDPLPGAFSVQRRASAPVVYVCKGAVVRAKTATEPSVVLIRFWEKDAEGSAFILLNQKLAELTHEITRRREVEEALRRARPCCENEQRKRKR